MGAQSGSQNHRQSRREKRAGMAERTWKPKVECRKQPSPPPPPDLWLLRENGKIVGPLEHGNAPEIDSTMDLPFPFSFSFPRRYSLTLSLFLFIYPSCTLESKPDGCDCFSDTTGCRRRHRDNVSTGVNTIV